MVSKLINVSKKMLSFCGINIMNSLIFGILNINEYKEFPKLPNKPFDPNGFSYAFVYDY